MMNKNVHFFYQIEEFVCHLADKETIILIYKASVELQLNALDLRRVLVIENLMISIVQVWIHWAKIYEFV